MELFERYSPFIQDFIYAHGWQELRPVQTAAAEVLFGTEDNLLLTSSTASGKTEAAFFPILSLMSEAGGGGEGFGVVYIAPLKSLINDSSPASTSCATSRGSPFITGTATWRPPTRTRRRRTRTASCRSRPNPSRAC